MKNEVTHYPCILIENVRRRFMTFDERTSNDLNAIASLNCSRRTTHKPIQFERGTVSGDLVPKGITRRYRPGTWVIIDSTVSKEHGVADCQTSIFNRVEKSPSNSRFRFLSNSSGDFSSAKLARRKPSFELFSSNLRTR